MPNKAKVAIIGTGWWSTTAHFPSLLAHPDAEVTAIVDPRTDILSKAGETYGISNTYTKLSEMLNREQLDGAVIATWHSTHYDIAKTCLEHGLNIMVEKPMVLSASHAKDLIELANKRELEIIVGNPYHFTKRAKRIREVVTSGALGEVLYINSYFTSMVIEFLRGNDTSYKKIFGYPVTGPGNVYADTKLSGGGQGHLQVTHSASLMHFITGLKPVSVSALMNNLEFDDVKKDVIDAMTIVMNNGALANVGSAGNLQLNDSGKLSIQLNCESGRVDIDFITGAGIIRHKNGTEEIFPAFENVTPSGSDKAPNNDEAMEAYPLHATASNLVDVITGKATNGSPGEIGWHTVELLDAAYRSAAKNGQSVKVASLY